MSRKKLLATPKTGEDVTMPLTQEEIDEREAHEADAMQHELAQAEAAKAPRLADVVFDSAIDTHQDEDGIREDLDKHIFAMEKFCEEHQAIARANGHPNFAKDFNALKAAVAHIKKHAERTSYWKRM